jgi:hypothetical protein
MLWSYGPRITSRTPFYPRCLARQNKTTGTCTRDLNEARRGKYQILGTRYLQISREAVRIQRACFSLIVAVLFCIRPANLWRTLWQLRFVFWLSVGRSGRI